MRLPDFIASNKTRLVGLWKEYAVSRLSLELEHSALVNDLPEFIDDLVEAMRTPTHRWPPIESARSHGRQRMRSGTDVGTLTEEMVLLGEVIVELAQQDGVDLVAEDVMLLIRVIGRGAAASVSTYAAVRDRQVAAQAAQHFSFIAHEIRNPLHNAHLVAELLTLCPEKDRAEYVRRLSRSLVQLERLVDDFLVNARLSSDAELAVEQVQARALVAPVWEDVAPQAESRGLQVSMEIDDVGLEADRRLIVSALSNLMRNAVKFTRSGGRVVLRAKRTDDRAVFEVEDECGGMPEDLPPRLFQPFVQGSFDRRGHGLGLLIVKQAIEAHGGKVRVANYPGRGCCFSAELPLKQAP